MSMYYRRAMITGVSGVSWGLLSIFIFLVLPTISSVADPVPTNEDDQSICKQHHRLTELKDVSYIETYEMEQWGRYYQKTRLNFKSQKFTKWASVEMCCPGYEPNKSVVDAGNCVPVCPSDCLNGTCHRPNECKCDPGYFVSINNSTGFSECQPNCTSGCHGGTCIQPEICICDIGYIARDERSRCQASCDAVGGSGFQNCGENATCIAPDQCKCDNGYVAVINETAEEESISSTWDWLSTEKPPLQITFNSSDVICKPLCKPECEENADCVAPNKCQCTTGYTAAFSSDEPTQCIPVCRENCVNSFCSRPNKCTCYEGYKPHDWLGKAYCEPICQDDCINGKCTHPNHCECAVGYEKLVVGSGKKQIASENVCVPVCLGNCNSNGRCVAPGQCHCLQGYVFKALGNQADVGFTNTENITSSSSINLKSQGSCQPNCEPDCIDGYFCIAPNQCQIQYDNDKVLDRFPKFRTRIINNTDDCGVGHLLTKNNRTGCLYKLNDTECYEPNICAIIMVDHQKMIKNFTFLRRFDVASILVSILTENFLSATSIVSVIDGTQNFNYNVSHSKNNQTFKWRMPRCTKECRILVLFGGISKIVHEDEIDDCYEFKSHNKSTGVFLRPSGSPSLIRQNGIRRLGGVWVRYPALCFLKDDFTSNTKTSMKTENVVESNVRVVVISIIGTAITIVLIIGLGVLLYRGRQKLSRLRHFRGVSASNDTVMDGSMAQFNTGEN